MTTLKEIFQVFRYADLIRALVNRDLKVRYKSSVLGYMWTWLDPLMSMLVFILVFDVILRIKVEHFPVYLLTGLIPWTFFSNAISGSVGSITRNAAIIKKVYYPREIFPLTTMLSEGMNMTFSLLVLVPVVFLSGIALTPWVLLLPLPLIMLFTFTFGLCLLCSTINVFFRDMTYIIPFTLRLWFFMTPIFWEIESRVPGSKLDTFLNIYMPLNPMAVIITLFRTCLMGRPAPALPYVAAGCFWCILAFVVGYTVFKRCEDAMVKRI